MKPPPWAPYVLIVAIVAWSFAWYFVLGAIARLGDCRYEQGLRIDPPRWCTALSFALWLPGIMIAGLGFLGLGALLVASVGSLISGGPL